MRRIFCRKENHEHQTHQRRAIRHRSDWRCKPHQVERFLTPLPVRKIPGVGKATEAVLHDMKIMTVSDLREFSEPDLVERFGKWLDDEDEKEAAPQLWSAAAKPPL
jgi:nucleotidyltransferase/DNA polymerase involved in DNA repair